ncbi:cytochrome b5 [Basidiobolus meristosporus CBS 931.73]|uniref:Cytochrome b5 n=1 Tax=Basidiobolus meristosporus CBS 931.73 TaxID=1314790 RepID=A0A1Y1XWE1_9FUNG|nr:cytochrome b5 [Basidiobolus meristosporus CBS 931.73]|eukprot:ORX90038.1 cytochrome b5 [Basidiobolus meristosporus CBS 931.73]
MPKIFSAEEVNAHNTKSDAWFCIEGKIYNVTNFIDQHPGGEEVILEQVGSDASEAFIDVGHSEDAKRILEGLYIGELAPGVSSQRMVLILRIANELNPPFRKLWRDPLHLLSVRLQLRRTIQGKIRN